MTGCNPEHLAGVQQGYYLPVNLCLSTRGPASLYVLLTMHSAPSYSLYHPCVCHLKHVPHICTNTQTSFCFFSFILAYSHDIAVNYYNAGSLSLLFVVVCDVTITIFITACNLDL